MLWVRSGTSWKVRPGSGSGYNTAVITGTNKAVLQKRSAGGELLAESNPFSVIYRTDSEAPRLQLSLSGGREHHGVFYGKDRVSVRLSAPADSGSGVADAKYELHADTSYGPVLQRGDLREETLAALDADGTYVMTVSAVDRTGNRSETASVPITVDSVPPRITVTGITADASRNHSVKIRVTGSDSALDPAGFTAQVEGRNSGRILQGVSSVSDENSAVLTFPEIGTEQSEDDLYTLRVTAQDYAGNRTEKELSFTVNTRGSVYSLSEETEQKLNSYWHTEPFNVVFLESNLDEVESARVICIRDRETLTLQEGSGVTCVQSKTEGAGRLYRYTVNADQFSREGRYEAVLLSKDRSGGKSDTAAQLLRVRFGIDRTAPDCVITGIKSGAAVRAASVMMGLEPRDNLSLAGLRLYVNGRQVLEKSGEDIQSAGGFVKYRLEEKSTWQHVQAYVWDSAGNEYWTDLQSVYLSSAEDQEIPVYDERTAAQFDRAGTAQLRDQTSGVYKTEGLIKRAAAQLQSRLNRLRSGYVRAGQESKEAEESKEIQKSSEIHESKELQESKGIQENKGIQKNKEVQENIGRQERSDGAEEKTEQENKAGTLDRLTAAFMTVFLVLLYILFRLKYVGRSRKLFR